MRKVKIRIALLLYPEAVLAEAFNRGTIHQRLRNMMDYGVLKHTDEDREKILKESSFEDWLKTSNFDYERVRFD
jgi:hypothetical protein